MLEGRDFIIFTDQKPVTKKITSDIRHVKVQENQTADALSRLEMNVIQHSRINFETNKTRIKNYETYLQRTTLVSNEISYHCLLTVF